jgi:hypothetical protein
MLDAVTGKLTDSRSLPWYLTAIALGKPLLAITRALVR